MPHWQLYADQVAGDTFACSDATKLVASSGFFK